MTDTIRLDVDGGDGGSSLTLAGALTNSGTLDHRQHHPLGVGQGDGGVARQYGQDLTDRLRRQPGAPRRDAAARDSARRERLERTVRLAGDSAIEFASGQITSLADGAQLDLNGNDAFIEDSTTLGSNSALTGLASIGAGVWARARRECRRPARSPMTETSFTTKLSVDDRRAGHQQDIAERIEPSRTGTCQHRRADRPRILPRRLDGGSDDQQRLDFDPDRHRGARRSGPRHGVLQPRQRPIFSSTRASRPGRPSTRPARTRSRSSRRRISPPRSPVSEPATRSTRRTFSRRRRRTISSRI